jgi:hypothetical protein
LKIIFLVSIVLLFVITPAYGGLLSDATGLTKRLDIQTGGHTFEIETTSNYDITNFEFNKDEKKLTIFITSSLENNLGEVILPQNLLGGNLTFHLNDMEYFPKVKSNEKVSFVTLNFTGSGDNKLDIFGTTYLSGLTEIPESKISSPSTIPATDDGLNYVIIIVILLIIGGVVGVVAFSIKRRN